MKKVLVIGSSGAGKSVFSRRLGEVTGLPVIHLDQHFWQPGWVEMQKPAWREYVSRLLEGDEWIIDGNYGGTMELRLDKCDTVIFLDLPRHVCTWRVLKRVLQNLGRTRFDLAPECPERLDLSFLRWTWNYPRRSRPQVLERLARVRGRVDLVALTSKREVEHYLESHRMGKKDDKRS